MRTANLAIMGILFFSNMGLMSVVSSCTSKPFRESGEANRWRPPSRRFTTWLDYVKNFIPPQEKDIMPYKNLYKGSSTLAGIEAYQKPVVDNALGDYSEYIGKHPGTVCYHFWDGRILWLSYSPDGRIIRKEWGHHAENEAADYFMSWEMVDFSTGSDSHFKHHIDPRKSPATSMYPPG